MKKEEIKKKISSEEKWVHIFCNFKEKLMSILNLKLILQYIFCLPGTSTVVIRIFSIIKNTWSEKRGKKNENIIRDLMISKINFALTLNEFYKKI